MNKKETERGLDMAMPYTVCPVTGEHIYDGIYIRSDKKGNMPLLPENRQTFREHYHYKCIGVSPTLSKKAKESIGEGFYLVEYDPEKTTEENYKQGNVYRTGRIVGLKKEVWGRMFKTPFPENQWTYVPAPFVQNLLMAYNEQK